MIDEDLMKLAASLRLQANELERKARRKMPDAWKVGQKIRYLNDNEWAWSKGQTAYIKALRHGNEGNPKYQVFYTGDPGREEIFWTTPNDVELVEE